jgi:hexosaminidase
VFFPSAIEASVSDDGKDYRPFASRPTGYEPVADNAGTKAIKVFSVKGNAKARYVRLKVKNFGKMPAWHISAGEQAWLFVDEVEVK